VADILLVEDDPDICESVRAVLEDEGHIVRTANNGHEALAALGQRIPALVLVDLLMPVMDGIELIEAMREKALWAAIPVIILSASSTVSPPADIPVLRKPIGIDALVAAVAKHLGA
jgi:CheY-like chemotaxis protein